jgi:DnaJ-class molecular chaperone
VTAADRPLPRSLNDDEWLAAHDYPRCPHGLSLYAICEDCRAWEVPASNRNDTPDTPPKDRCGACNGSGLATTHARDPIEDDVCPYCAGEGKAD